MKDRKIFNSTTLGKIDRERMKQFDATRIGEIIVGEGYFHANFGGNVVFNEKAHILRVSSIPWLRLRSPLFILTRASVRSAYPVDHRRRDKSAFPCFNTSSFQVDRDSSLYHGKLVRRKVRLKNSTEISCYVVSLFLFFFPHAFRRLYTAIK